MYLQDILLENDVHIGIILLIKDIIYSNNFSQIRIQSELSEKVAIIRGARQRDYLNTLLFSIVIDKIVSYVKRLQGHRMGSEEINIVVLC